MLLVVSRWVIVAAYTGVTIYTVILYLRANTTRARRILGFIGTAATVWCCFYLWLFCLGFFSSDSTVALVSRLAHLPTIGVLIASAAVTDRTDAIIDAVRKA